jgi:hypothetical protein
VKEFIAQTCAYETIELGNAFPFHYTVCEAESLLRAKHTAVHFRRHIPVLGVGINFHSKAKYIHRLASVI